MPKYRVNLVSRMPVPNSFIVEADATCPAIEEALKVWEKAYGMARSKGEIRIVSVESMHD